MDLVKTARGLLGPAWPPARDALAAAAAGAGLTDPARRMQGRLTIATFHRVLPERERRLYPLPGLAVTPAELAWFMEYFTRRYRCGPLTETVRRWRAGASEERPLLAVTFDDGQLDNFVNARPVLDRFGVRASFFVPVGHIETSAPLWHDRLGFAALRALEKSQGRDELRDLLHAELPACRGEIAKRVIGTAKALGPGDRQARLRAIEEIAGRCDDLPEWAGMMGWSHLETLRDEGHEIGSHGMTHELLPQCDNEALRYEVASSREVLEARLGIPAGSFCYPNGSCDERVVTAVRRAGYESAVTTEAGSNRSEQSLFRLRRFDMCSDHVRSRRGRLSDTRLALRLSGLQPGLRA